MKKFAKILTNSYGTRPCFSFAACGGRDDG